MNTKNTKNIINIINLLKLKRMTMRTLLEREKPEIMRSTRPKRTQLISKKPMLMPLLSKSTMRMRRLRITQSTNGLDSSTTLTVPEPRETVTTSTESTTTLKSRRSLRLLTSLMKALPQTIRRTKRA